MIKPRVQNDNESWEETKSNHVVFVLLVKMLYKSGLLVSPTSLLKCCTLISGIKSQSFGRVQTNIPRLVRLHQYQFAVLSVPDVLSVSESEHVQHQINISTIATVILKPSIKCSLYPAIEIVSIALIPLGQRP